MIVGGGPYEARLRTLASGAPDGSVVFAGPGARGGSASLLRDGRSLRDALSLASGRHGGRRMGQRVHRGVRVRASDRRRATPAARARRSSTARPVSWSTAATSIRSRMPSPGCSRIRSAPGGWGRRDASASSVRTRGRRSPARLAGWLRQAVGVASASSVGQLARGTLPAWPKRLPPRPNDIAHVAAPSCMREPSGAGCASSPSPPSESRSRSRKRSPNRSRSRFARPGPWSPRGGPIRSRFRLRSRGRRKAPCGPARSATARTRSSWTSARPAARRSRR